jgi:microcystin-dependent protein
MNTDTTLPVRQNAFEILNTSTGGKIHFSAGGGSAGAPHMVVAPGGNVGIGTTDPLDTLAVVGDISFTGNLFQNGVPFTSGGGGEALPLGAFVRYPWSAAIPSGFLKCDGAEVPKVGLYELLFSVIGDVYGTPTDPNNFVLPLFFDYVIKFSASGASIDYIPIGSIFTITWNIDPYPDGFLKCDGSDVSRATYNQLFSAIGEGYGPGDGSTTFTLPLLFNQGIKYITTVVTGDITPWVPTLGGTVYSLGNVGIGTTNPSVTLDTRGKVFIEDTVPLIGGQGTSLVVRNEQVGGSILALQGPGISSVAMFLTNGNVGIGTGSPDQKLDVNGNASIRGDRLFTNTSGSTNPFWIGLNGTATEANRLGVAIRGEADGTIDLLSLQTNGTQRISVLKGGNVGIGISNPQYLLDVVQRNNEYIFHNSLYSNDTSWGVEWRTTRSMGTPEAPQAITNGTSLWGIYIGGQTSPTTRSNNSVVIRAVATENFTTSAQGAKLDFATTTNGSNGRNIRMTIENNGNVGIGVTNPVNKLQIGNITGHVGYGLAVDNGSFGIVSKASGIPLTCQDSNDNALFRVLGTGFVGIGTNPSYPFHVAISGTGSSDSGQHGFLNESGAGSSSSSNMFPQARFSGTVHALLFRAFSDTRIKKDIELINDSEALQTLRLIEPKKYKYIDNVKKGNDTVFGFIAQEIREYFPNAIGLDKDFIPDVYHLYPVNLETHSITIPGKAKVGKLRVYTQTREVEIDVTSTDENTVVFSEDSLTEDDLKDGSVFVYGYEVDDFHTLNKDYLFTINFAATQELDRKVQTLEQEKQELINKVTAFETELLSLKEILRDKGIIE